MSENLDHMLQTPLVPLRPEWRHRQQSKDLAHARKLDAQNPDRYWEWVAEQQRWMTDWESVREGDFEGFRFFDGACLNVADNCVYRYAEDPATSDKVAIAWEGEPGDSRSITYGELSREVTQLAAALRKLQVDKGDVVAIYMPNLIEAFVAVHACNHIGAIYTILFSGFGPEAVESRIRGSRAKVVITADASYRRGRIVPLLETLRAAIKDVAHVRQTIVVNRTGRDLPLSPGEVLYEDALELGRNGTPVRPLEANEPSFLIFTSGTEAKPKGLVHSVGGFLLGTWANVKWQVSPRDGDVYWVAADVGWLTFPIQAIVGGLAHGMTILCFEGALDTPTTARFYEICENHSVTKVLTAPTVIRMLRKFGDDLCVAHPLPLLRLMTVQGEPLDGDTFSWGTEHLGGGVPVVNAYGQTETGSTWVYPVAEVEDLKPGSTGTVVPGHRCEVVDDDGVPVPVGIKGNLVMTTPFPTLARTVWDDPERYHSAYFDRFPGRYNTNDEAVVDADGHLWVLGRSDDVINVAAHRISTLEVEAIVTAHPGVVEAAVVGVHNATKGTVPIAFVTLVDGAVEAQVTKEVTAEVVSNLGAYARLDAIYCTAALPKTRTGKIMRRLLREIVETGQVKGDISAMEDESALAAVTQAVGAV